MTVSTAGLNLGRHVFGAAVLAFGLVTLAWPNYDDWLSHSVLSLQAWRAFIYVAAAAQIVGGAAIQFPRTARAGAIAIGAAYFIFAILCIPQIIAAPRVYDSWGNFFEQLSIATGAAIVYAHASSVWDAKTLDRIARILFGICVVSFTLEQAFYLKATATLVPRWFPPGQTFWADATTVLFALGAVALLTNRMALLAARLLTAMLLVFGLLVWIPLLFAGPHVATNWGETVETFAITGTAWILADLLGASGLRKIQAT